MTNTKRKKPPARQEGETDGGIASKLARDSREARVDVIVDLMSRGEWFAARTTRELARKWDVSTHAVSEYAREASGIVRHALRGHEDAIRDVVLAGVDEIRRVAQLGLVRYVRVGTNSKGKAVIKPVREPQLDAALRAHDLKLKALGLYPADRMRITTQELTEPTTEEERRAQLEQLKRDVEEELAGIVADETTQKGSGT